MFFMDEQNYILFRVGLREETDLRRKACLRSFQNSWIAIPIKLPSTSNVNHLKIGRIFVPDSGNSFYFHYFGGPFMGEEIDYFDIDEFYYKGYVGKEGRKSERLLKQLNEGIRKNKEQFEEYEIKINEERKNLENAIGRWGIHLLALEENEEYDETHARAEEASD